MRTMQHKSIIINWSKGASIVIFWGNLHSWLLHNGCVISPTMPTNSSSNSKLHGLFAAWQSGDNMSMLDVALVQFLDARFRIIHIYRHLPLSAYSSIKFCFIFTSLPFLLLQLMLEISTPHGSMTIILSLWSNRFSTKSVLVMKGLITLSL